MHSGPDPSLTDIDAVLAFLPVVAAPGFDPGRLHTTRVRTDGDDEQRALVGDASEPAEAGARPLPYFEGSPELDGLIQTLHDHHFIVDFDWSEWQPVADRYARNPALLRDAGLGTLRKLFTTHVRREPFADGHLAEVARSGHLLDLLRRLSEIRGALAEKA